MIGYDELVRLRTHAESARIRADLGGQPANKRAAIAAKTAFDAALAGTVGQLDPAVPLLLLPVRLETRYQIVPGAPVQLLVRVYPDVDIDEHEPALTPAEVKAGQTFWTASWTASGEIDRQTAWTELVTRVGRLRAAWVRHSLTPENQPTAAEPPRFPQPPEQAARWMRARRAMLLPDRWVAHAYRADVQIGTAAGNLITRPLPAGPDPAAPLPTGPDPDLADPGMRWMVDFDAAVDAGMGLVLELPDKDPVDLITVTGVRGSVTPAEDATALSDLLAAHRYHVGVDLVPPGTPTNNTDDGRSAHGSAEPTGAADLAVVSGGPRATAGDGSDADLLARALGIQLGILAELPHSGCRAVADQADVAAVLWPATWGYYLTQLLRLNDVDAGLESWRRWVLDTVRPGGPLPAIRIGDQPYGVLPTTSLARWRPRHERGNLVTAELVASSAGLHTNLWAHGQLNPQGSWTFRLPLGAVDTPAEATGVAVAVRDRAADGHPEILIGHAGTAGVVGSPRPGVVRCGLFALRGDHAEPTGTVELPAVAPPLAGGPLSPMGLGLALGSLRASRVHGPDVGGTDLIALVQTPPARSWPPRLVTVTLHVGRGLDRTGAVTEGWASPLDVSAVFGRDERVLSAELVDRPGEGADLAVLSTVAPVPAGPPPAGSIPVNYRVARGVTRDGTVTGGWTAPVQVGFPAGDARLVGASATVDDDVENGPRLLLGEYSTFATGGFVGSYMVGTDLTDGVPGRWSGAIGASSGEGELIGAAAAFARWLPVRSPAIGLQFTAGRVNLLTALADQWRTALPGVARVRPGDHDPSRTLLDLLTTDDVSSSYQVRPFIGPQVLESLRFVVTGPATGGPVQPWTTLEPLLNQFGLFAGRIPRLGSGGFATSTLDATDPFVSASTPGWELEPVGWLRDLATATAAELHARWTGPGVALLVRLVRHSLLQAYADAAFALVPVPFPVDPPPLPEPELVDLVDITLTDPGPPGTTLTSWRHLSTAKLGGAPVADVIYQAARSATPPSEVAPLAEALAALRRLSSRQAGELARLAAGTLDAATHRLDAWITAVATDRLRALRGRTPEGLHVGGYGYVTNLRPASGTASTGYVHAPSPAHAVTAGVLRSGFLTHSGEALAVDLSSARVRRALEVLDAVREGQSIGAVLGYRFERDLHDASLAQYLSAFRQLAPERVGVLTPLPAGTPAADVAGLVTVDGLALLGLLAEDGLPWGTTPAGQAQALPPDGTDHHRLLTGVLAKLRDGADAVSDLGIAESVHQTLQRNHLHAGGSLDALSRGELPPPEPEVVRTPRTGVGVTHRVLAVAPDPAQPAAAAALAAWTATTDQRALHARAAAEPRLNAWAALVLGDPSRVRWRVGYRDPATGEPTDRQDEFTLAAAGLCPLDILAASSPGVATLVETNLGSRLRRHATRQPAAPGRTTDPELLLDRAPDWAADVLSVPELLTVADAARTLIATAREATGQDLAAAGTRTGDGIVADELHTRALNALDGLAGALDALRARLAVTEAGQTLLAALFPGTFPTPETAAEITSLVDLPLICDLALAVPALTPLTVADLDALRDSLELLSGYGLTGAAPVDPAGAASDAAVRLAVQARAVAVEGAARLAAAGSANNDLAMLAAVFGPGFRALPLVDTSAAGTPPTGVTQAAVDDWFDDVSRVREPVGRLADLLLLAAATGGADARWRVLQQPASGARWVALSPAVGDPPARIPAGCVSVALAALSDDQSPAAKQAMLAVDSWVEVVPNVEENTAVAFHFDAPANCAPQALLLAVHPDPDLPWDDDTVADVVRETAELARLRMVDPDLVPVAGHLLPALLFAQNVGGDPAGDTVSTSLRG